MLIFGNSVAQCFYMYGADICIARFYINIMYFADI